MLYAFGDPARGVCLDQLPDWQRHRKPFAKKTPVGAGHTDHAKSDDEFSTGIDWQGPPIKREYNPENVALVERELKLAGLSPDDGRDQWKAVVWAILSLGDGWDEFADSWSRRSDKYDADGYANVVESFDPTRKKYNWVEALARRNDAYSKPITALGGDVYIGTLFALDWRDKLLWVHEMGGGLLSFDAATGWIHAPPMEADRAAKETVGRLVEYAAKLLRGSEQQANQGAALLKLGLRYADVRNLRAMQEAAKSEPGMVRRLVEFDADPMLLGTTNGVVDLRRFVRRPITPDLLLTKRGNVAIDPTAKCPKFQEFLRQIRLSRISGEHVILLKTIA